MLNKKKKVEPFGSFFCLHLLPPDPKLLRPLKIHTRPKGYIKGVALAICLQNEFDKLHKHIEGTKRKL